MYSSFTSLFPHAYCTRSTLRPLDHSSLKGGLIGFGAWCTHCPGLVPRTYLESGFSLGLFQRPLCPLGALMCPLGLAKNQQCALLGPPQNQHIFTLELINCLDSEYRTQWTLNAARMLCWQWYACNKCLVLTDEGAWSWGIICALWPVNSSMNTALSV